MINPKTFRELVEGDYKWSSDGATHSYRNWFTNRPNDDYDSDTVRDCVNLRYEDGQWDDVDCAAVRAAGWAMLRLVPATRPQGQTTPSYKNTVCAFIS